MKSRTVIVTVEMGSVEPLKEIRDHVAVLLDIYDVRQVEVQVAQPPKAKKAKKVKS